MKSRTGLPGLLLIGIVILMIMPLRVSAIFKSDTLVLSFKKSSQEYSGEQGWGYVITKTFEQHRLRVRYADSAIFSTVSYDDAHWEIDTSAVVSPGKGKSVYWYRFKLRVDKDYTNLPFVMLFEGEGALELYVAGALKARIGKLPTGAGKENKSEYLNAHPVILNFADTGTYQLALRYKSNLTEGDDYETWFKVYVADAKYYFKQLKVGGIFSSLLFVGVGSVFFTLFLLHFLFFIFYRKEKANLFFAIFTLSIAVVMFAFYALFNAERMKYDSVYILTLNFVSIISCFSLSAFTTYIFSKNKLAFKIVVIATVATLMMALMDYYSLISFSYLIIWALLTASLLYTVIMMIRSIVLKQPGSLVLGSGVLFFILFSSFVLIYAIINRGISFNNTLILFSAIAIFSIPISISAYLAWRFSTTSKDLSTQLKNVELLSSEKQQLLQNQNETLEIQVSERTLELQQEKKKSDDLLLNILPHEIAEELKATGQSKAHQYDEVSVLFTDFVNFTQISEKLGVDELLEELNINFTAFDRIMEKYGLEKIKTIGDAYLAVSGLPVANEAHAVDAVNAALDIIDFVTERKKQVAYGLDIRIGINSGSLIAGIIGVKKFAYDIWGDTVNIAARMEQSSEPGKVNISESTYQLVKDSVDCTHRGKVDAKHKGEMDMYFVKGKR